MLEVSHFGGKAICKTIEELDNILLMRYGVGVNEFWISVEGVKFPCIALLVNSDYANIHYFPEDTHAGFQAVDVDNGLPFNELSTFYVNTENEEIEASNEFVTTFVKAQDVIREYFTSHSMPTCTEWFEL